MFWSCLLQFCWIIETPQSAARVTTMRSQLQYSDGTLVLCVYLCCIIRSTTVQTLTDIMGWQFLSNFSMYVGACQAARSIVFLFSTSDACYWSDLQTSTGAALNDPRSPWVEQKATCWRFRDCRKPDMWKCFKMKMLLFLELFRKQRCHAELMGKHSFMQVLPLCKCMDGSNTNSSDVIRRG